MFTWTEYDSGLIKRALVMQLHFIINPSHPFQWYILIAYVIHVHVCVITSLSLSLCMVYNSDNEEKNDWSDCVSIKIQENISQDSPHNV